MPELAFEQAESFVAAVVSRPEGLQPVDIFAEDAPLPVDATPADPDPDEEPGLDDNDAEWASQKLGELDARELVLKGNYARELRAIEARREEVFFRIGGSKLLWDWHRKRLEPGKKRRVNDRLGYQFQATDYAPKIAVADEKEAVEYLLDWAPGLVEMSVNLRELKAAYDLTDDDTRLDRETERLVSLKEVKKGWVPVRKTKTEPKGWIETATGIKLTEEEFAARFLPVAPCQVFSPETGQLVDLPPGLYITETQSRYAIVCGLPRSTADGKDMGPIEEPVEPAERGE